MKYDIESVVSVNREHKLMIFANGVLLLMFLIISRAEYNLFDTHIVYSPNFYNDLTVLQAKQTFFHSCALTVFTASTILNLYFIFRLKRNRETKPNQ
jgi:hypothetical protein